LAQTKKDMAGYVKICINNFCFYIYLKWIVHSRFNQPNSPIVLVAGTILIKDNSMILKINSKIVYCTDLNAKETAEFVKKLSKQPETSEKLERFYSRNRKRFKCFNW
jgi:hypothetical protein